MERDDLRIGDAEREQTMAALREHFAQGRLTHEELDERLDRTLTAKTGRDLTQITADLPGHQPTPQHAMDDWRASMMANRYQVEAMRQAHGDMRQAHREMRRQWHRHGHPWRQHHRGPHPFVGVLFGLMVLSLIFGLGIFKVLFALFVGAMVFSLIHRRFHYRR
ncbi:DUF1707 SHOCT-like domain-containing protein [Nonomuraea turcica]|uniref:DUF1707 SHOCT-like domain-containing protein n=1 Tax=Nonomuraea sp. G32 TaxID=3067274 RepID=UPI00273BA38A|nr:DUF1707 domain-containing protein [Nonomuraea sp. G32]MDP4508810.1 DUF1707 domain-containing protein [Nonomuraea sp. G32]